MAIQVVVGPFDDSSKYYPRRGDRVYEQPTDNNAQGLFPPAACVFVGNLSTKVTVEQLAEDLKEKFSMAFGKCHVKIKHDRKKGLPGAFVQFEKVKDAQVALAWNECTTLHERWLRIERSRGRRTACLGLRDGRPITPAEVLQVLKGKGPLEVYSIEPIPTVFDPWMNMWMYTDVCNVTFAYVDDCKDAIKHFQYDPVYYLMLLDVEGNPLLGPQEESTVMDDLVGNPNKRSFSTTAAADNTAMTTTTTTRKTAELLRDIGAPCTRLDAAYQPTSGKTVEQYAHEIYQKGEDELSDHEIMEVIQQLEEERKVKCEWFDHPLDMDLRRKFENGEHVSARERYIGALDVVDHTYWDWISKGWELDDKSIRFFK